MPEASETRDLHVHAALARAVSDNGVDTMFGVIGDANLYMADSFVRDCGGQFVSAANEAGAVLMALGCGYVSDRLSVATVTHGPALCNTMTALVEGVKGRVPLLLLCGDTPMDERANFQDIAQREVILAAGAGFEQLRGPDSVAEDVAIAIRRAWLERRPVALNMPREYQWLRCSYAPRLARLADNRAIVPESTDLDNAIGIIAAARKPVVLAGRGAANPEARTALIRLAARIGAPLATTLKGAGLFASEPYDLGVFGTLSSQPATDIILDADCIVAFGASLNRYTSSKGTFLDGKRVIQVNADAAEVGQHALPTIGVIGDAARTADLFVKWLDAAEIPSSGFRQPEMLAALAVADPVRECGRPAAPGMLDLARVIAALDEAIPDDRVLVSDGGRFLLQPWKIMKVKQPRSFVFTLHFGSIGLGLAEAIGAGKAAPGRPITLLTGDGGFMLGGLAEFNSAVRAGTDLIVLLFNDGAYGAEHIQFRMKHMDPALSMFDWPDFAEVARSLGGDGVTIRTEADLPGAREAIAGRRRPLLIDIKLDPDQMPSVR